MKNEKTLPKTKGSNRVKLIILSVFLLIAAVAVFFFVQYKETHISTDDAYITNDIFWVHPKVSGSIKRVFIDDNQYVKKGTVLAVIDPKPYKIKLAQALAQLNLAKAKAKEARAVVEARKSDIDVTKAKLDKALWDFNRSKRLLKTRAISRNRYEQYLTNYNVLKFSLISEKELLKQSVSSLLSAKKNIDAALSSFDGAKLNLSYTTIKAPASGFVTKKNVEVGKFVSPSIPICAVVPNKNAWIVANYKEDQIEKMQKGQKVKIKIDAYPHKTFEGRIDSIQSGTGEVFSLFPPENASGNWIKVTQRIPVKIVFNKQPNVILRIGMSAVATVLIKK